VFGGSGAPRVGTGRRGSVLLEVLVTVTILAMFMALIGGQILASVRAAETIQRRQTAILLAESLIGRLQSGGFELADQSQQFSDTFGDAYPGWGWQVYAEPTDQDETLVRVRLQVLQDETGEGLSVDAMKPIVEMTTFQAMPVKFNLVDDFGMSEADAEALAATGIDPYNLNPASLLSMDLGDLLSNFPQLEGMLAMYGLDASALSSMDPEMLRSALEGVLGSGGGGGDSGGSGESADGNDGPLSSEEALSEVMRLLESGDKEGAIDYIREHEDELNDTGEGGRR
jgi:type II secretory pathway pseudopilin PulG